VPRSGPAHTLPKPREPQIPHRSTNRDDRRTSTSHFNVVLQRRTSTSSINAVDQRREAIFDDVARFDAED
jgi:hypothetical protein